MDYVIVEMVEPAATEGNVVVGRYDSAYAATEALRATAYRRGGRARKLYLLDPAGRVLVRPSDIQDMIGV